MYFKKILIAFAIITTIKLSCTETEVMTCDNTSRHSVACQTSQEDFPLRHINNAIFVSGNFNPEYKFSKSEIARLSLLQLVITIDSVVSILGSMAYNTGVFALNLATTLWRNS